jgi:hypothetical protein
MVEWQMRRARGALMSDTPPAAFVLGSNESVNAQARAPRELGKGSVEGKGYGASQRHKRYVKRSRKLSCLGIPCPFRDATSAGSPRILRISINLPVLTTNRKERSQK